jgi:hypothetical protein
MDRLMKTDCNAGRSIQPAYHHRGGWLQQYVSLFVNLVFMLNQFSGYSLAPYDTCRPLNIQNEVLLNIHYFQHMIGANNNLDSIGYMGDAIVEQWASIYLKSATKRIQQWVGSKLHCYKLL